MRTWRKINYLRPALARIKGKLAAIALITVLVSFIALLPPYLSKLLFDQGVTAGNINKIVYYGLLAIATYLLVRVQACGVRRRKTLRKTTIAVILGRCNKSLASYYVSRGNKSKHADIDRHKEETMVKERISESAGENRHGAGGESPLRSKA